MSSFKSALLVGLLLLGLGHFPQVAQACDVCVLFPGATPNVLNNRAGVFFRYRTFDGLYNGSSYQKTNHFPSGIAIATPEDPVLIRERYASSVFYGRWFFKPRWNVQVQLPLVYNQAEVGSFRKSLNGLGDATAVVSATVIDRSDEVSSLQLFLGAGVKLPTGSRFSDIEDYLEWFELQGSTGSVDALLRADLSWRRNKFGIVSSNMLRLNTRDRYQMRFGNFLNLSASGFYLQELVQDKVQIMPAVGGFLESYSGRSLEGQPVADVGGQTLFGTAGATLFIRTLALRAEVQVPVVQQLNGVQMLSNPAWVVDISYNF